MVFAFKRGQPDVGGLDELRNLVLGISSTELGFAEWKLQLILDDLLIEISRNGGMCLSIEDRLFLTGSYCYDTLSAHLGDGKDLAKDPTPYG